MNEKNSQTKFPPYYAETLKNVRDLLQKKFFSRPIPRLVPSSDIQLIDDIEK